MAPATKEKHELHIADPVNGNQTLVWNGEPEERAKAEAVFRAKMATNGFLAYKTIDVEAGGGGGTATVERTADKVQIGMNEFDPEARTTWVTPRLVGG